MSAYLDTTPRTIEQARADLGLCEECGEHAPPQTGTVLCDDCVIRMVRALERMGLNDRCEGIMK